MIKNKYIKWLVIVLCIFIFTVIAVMTGVMTCNVLHTEHCDINNCSLCSVIHMLADFSRNIWFANNDILILIAILSLIQLININIKKVKKLTQVELKVVQIK